MSTPTKKSEKTLRSKTPDKKSENEKKVIPTRTSAPFILTKKLDGNHLSRSSKDSMKKGLRDLEAEQNEKKSVEALSLFMALKTKGGSMIEV